MTIAIYLVDRRGMILAKVSRKILRDVNPRLVSDSKVQSDLFRLVPLFYRFKKESKLVFVRAFVSSRNEPEHLKWDLKRVYTAIYAFNSEEIRAGWQHCLSKANIVRVRLKYSKLRV